MLTLLLFIIKINTIIYHHFSALEQLESTRESPSKHVVVNREEALARQASVADMEAQYEAKLTMEISTLKEVL